MNPRVVVAIVILSITCLFGHANPVSTNDKSTFTGTYTVKSGQGLQVQNVVMTGIQVSSEDGILTCRRDCEVTLSGVLVKADEVYLNPRTGEAEARGSVRIKALPVNENGTRQP